MLPTHGKLSGVYVNCRINKISRYKKIILVCLDPRCETRSGCTPTSLEMSVKVVCLLCEPRLISVIRGLAFVARTVTVIVTHCAAAGNTVRVTVSSK